MNRLQTYFHIWFIHSSNEFQRVMVNRGTNFLFILGKVIRFMMTLFFLLLVRQQVREFGGFTTDQMVVFFLTYNLIDIVSQTVYRGVYMFSSKIRQGTFDYELTHPINPLFQSLATHLDPLDTILLLPNIILTIYIFSHLDITITIVSTAWYLALLLNSFLIVTAIHILILSLGILTTEVDNFIWLYRDLTRLGQFPATIYLEPVRFALFFVIPIGMMVSIPSEILIGAQPTYPILVATAMGITSLVVSLQIWKQSLKKYSSASS